MKKTIKQLLKISAMFFLLVLFSCEKEEIISNENKSNSLISEQKINYNSFSKKIKKENLDNSFLSRNKNQLINAKMINYFGLLINTDEILEINNQGNTTYTFSVKESGNNSDLINLVIEELDNGDLQEKLFIYRNYYNNNNAINNILIIKLENSTNALARFGSIICYEAVSMCNLGGVGHHKGHSDCNLGSSWYITSIPVDCPPSDEFINQIIEDNSGNHNTTTGSPNVAFFTPCSQSPSVNTQNLQASNVNSSSQNNSIFENGNVTTTTRPFNKKTPLDDIQFDEQEQVILDLHPNLTSLLNDFLKENPDEEDAVKSLLEYLQETAINDALNNTDEYKNLICSINSSENFITEALDIVDNGGEVDFENKIMIDSTFKDSQLDCIHKQLKQIPNGLYAKMLGEFNGGTNSTITLKIGTPPVGDWAITKGSATLPNNYTITIAQNVENGSNLMKTVTLCHELIHAYMFNTLEQANYITFDNTGAPKFNPLTSCNTAINYQNLDLNTLNTADRLVAVLCAMNQITPLTPQWSHNIFNTATFDIVTYRQAVENFIYANHDWDNESPVFKTRAINIFGNSWKQKIAQATSWIGLEQTAGYQNYINSHQSNFPQWQYLTVFKNLEILDAKSTCL